MSHRTITCCIILLLACLLVGSAAARLPGEWTANITYTAGTLVQNLTYGTNELGTDGYDAGLDNPAPPAPPSARNDYYFAIDDFTYDRLYGDIRGIVNATNTEKTWSLNVLSKDNDMILNWSISNIPQDISCTLNDATRDYDMRLVSSVSLTKRTTMYALTITARYTPPTPPVANFTTNVTSGIAPLVVQFTDTSSGSPTVWNWSFGNGEFSALQHPVYVYEIPGKYTVNLTATNAGGSNLSVKMNYMTVIVPPPSANFTANVTSGIVPLAVQFTDTSTGSPTGWNWSFGDGGVSVLRQPVHVYTRVGTYTVNLNVTNDGGSNVTVKTSYITVYPPPPPDYQWMANITYSAGTLVQNLTFGTNLSGTDGYDAGLDNPAPPAPPSARNDYYFAIDDFTYDRLYGDIRFIVNATNPERIWSLNVLSKDNDMILNWSISNIPQDISCTLNDATRDYDMRLVSSVTLTKRTAYYPVTITARYSPLIAPVANFSANVTYGIMPLAVQFMDTSTGSPTAWNWSFGDGSLATIQNPEHVYATAGTYSVCLNVTNAVGSNITTRTNYITVNIPAPVANFSANKTVGTVPMTVQFTDQSTGAPAAWAWNFGDGSTATERHPVHTYATAGIYTVSLNATNAGGSNTKTVTNYITVNIPAPVANFSANKTVGTVPMTVQFTDQSTGAPAAWAWNFGDGSTATERHPVHTYATAGIYTVSLNTTNAGGSNTKTAPNYITVNIPAPVANFSANKTSGAYPLAVGFTDMSVGTPTKWNWSFGDGSTATVQHPVHTYITNGTYTVSLNATNAGGSNTKIVTNYITVTVPIPPPVSNFTANVTVGLSPRTILFTDLSTGSPTLWNWSFGDNETATVQNPVHTYKQAGNHTVTLRSSNAGGMSTTIKDKYIIIYPKGDFNHNWKVDTGDAALVAYMVVNRAPHILPDADFNSNGFVDIGDAGKIAYFIVNKIKEL